MKKILTIILILFIYSCTKDSTLPTPITTIPDAPGDTVITPTDTIPVDTLPIDTVPVDTTVTPIDTITTKTFKIRVLGNGAVFFTTSISDGIQYTMYTDPMGYNVYTVILDSGEYIEIYGEVSTIIQQSPSWFIKCEIDGWHSHYDNCYINGSPFPTTIWYSFPGYSITFKMINDFNIPPKP